LHDAPLLIAGRLEAKGWPRHGSPAYRAEDLVADSEQRLSRAEDLLTRALAGAEKDPLFEPFAEAWPARKADATARLVAARAELTRLSGEEHRWPSRVEAERQLYLAAADGKITATGDFMGAPSAPPITGDVPAAAFNKSNGRIRRYRNMIATPWGRYENVKFIEADFNRVWPVGSTDANLTEWMLAYAEREAPRRVKREATVKLCMQHTGATWRQALEAYGKLPPSYVNQRGKPRRA
jgi:hypothetical protein